MDLAYLNTLQSTQEVVMPLRFGFVNLNVINTSTEIPAKTEKPWGFNLPVNLAWKKHGLLLPPADEQKHFDVNFLQCNGFWVFLYRSSLLIDSIRIF